MKHDINLAYKRPAGKKAAKSILFVLLFLAILGALSYTAILIPQMFKAAKVASLNELNYKLTALSETEKNFEQNTKIKNELLQNIEMLQELDTNKKDVSAVLRKIEESCPEGVEMTGMIFNPDTVSLSGISSSDVVLASFVANLNNIEDFKNVIVNKTEKNPDVNFENYTITITYTIPLRAEPITPPKAEQPTASPSQDKKEAKS